MSILLDGSTRVLIQGITGGEARQQLPYMLAYGTRIVAGVSPGKGGSRVEGIPVHDTIEEACAEHAIDMAVLFVPARHCREAALEAIAARIPTVVIVAEGVPHHDAALVLQEAREQGVRVIGPNAQGIISPGKAKVGGTGGDRPDRIFRPGPVGIISRSGGMGAEVASMLTRGGIGQSTYAAIGGDLLIGSDYCDLFSLYQEDPETRVLFLFGELGTGREEAAAVAIEDGKFRKPVVAFVAGDFLEGLAQGITFGHTGTLVKGSAGTAAGKKARLREAGVLVADRLDEIPGLVREALNQTLPLR